MEQTRRVTIVLIAVAMLVALLIGGVVLATTGSLSPGMELMQVESKVLAA
jgi:uncharacterized membrane protein affecting hemolysin expression